MSKALDTLGLPETATKEQVKVRYKELLKQHHPDTNGGDRSTEDRLQAVIQAYKISNSPGLAESFPFTGVKRDISGFHALALICRRI